MWCAISLWKRCHWTAYFASPPDARLSLWQRFSIQDRDQRCWALPPCCFIKSNATEASQKSNVLHSLQKSVFSFLFWTIAVAIHITEIKVTLKKTTQPFHNHVWTHGGKWCKHFLYLFLVHEIQWNSLTNACLIICSLPFHSLLSLCTTAAIGHCIYSKFKVWCVFT